MNIQKHGGKIAANSLVWGYALIILVPIIWVVSNSFKRQIDILTGKTFAPFTWSNYESLLFSRQSDFLGNLLNSVIISSIATTAVIMIATMAAYTLVRLNPPKWVKWMLLGWALFFHMLPTLTFVGSWFIMFSSVGLHGTYFAMISTLIVMNLPVALFLMVTFTEAVPVEIIQAARMDGCNSRQTFFQVVFPLVRGGMIAAAALVFIFAWSDFSVAVVLTSKDTMTVPVAIATFAQEFEIKYGEMAAGSVLSMIPAITLILFGQKFVVRGLLAGAVK